MADTSDDWYNMQVTENYFIKKITQDTYISNMKSIKHICDDSSIHNILLHPNKFAPMLMHIDTCINTQHNHFVTVLSYLRMSGLKESKHDRFIKWYKHFMIVKNTIKARIDNNIPDEKQQRNYMPWVDILKVRDNITYGSMDHLLVSLYTYVPPRRQLDYAMMKLYTDKKEVPDLDHNHFHLFCKKRGFSYMFVNDFKNVKFLRPFFNKEIPPKLVEIINATLVHSPRDHLFIDRFGKPFVSANAFQKYCNRVLKRVFGNTEMSVNVLRHSFSTFLSSVENITVGDRQRNATKMGHSLKKSLEYAFNTKVVN